MNNNFFHLVLVGVFVAFTGIRMYYHRKAAKTKGVVEYKEGKVHVGLRLVVGIPFIALVVAYFFQPGLLAWAKVLLPEWMQWLGVVLGLVTLPLIWWVQWALGANFSTVLHVRSEHTLVTYGPYRWVRHPMYTVLYIFGIAVFLLSQNTFLGLGFLVPLTLIVVTRLKNEESAMIEKFGDQYRTYMGRTGRFLPNLL